MSYGFPSDRINDSWAEMMSKMNSFLMEDILNKRSKERSMDYLNAQGEQSTALEKYRTENDIAIEKEKFMNWAAQQPGVYGKSALVERYKTMPGKEQESASLEKELNDDLAALAPAYSKLTTGRYKDLDQNDISAIIRLMPSQTANSIINQSGQTSRLETQMPLREGQLAVQQQQAKTAQGRLGLEAFKASKVKGGATAGGPADKGLIAFAKETYGKIYSEYKNTKTDEDRKKFLARQLKRVGVIRGKIVNGQGVSDEDKTYLTQVNDVANISEENNPLRTAYQSRAGELGGMALAEPIPNADPNKGLADYIEPIPNVPSGYKPMQDVVPAATPTLDVSTVAGMIYRTAVERGKKITKEQAMQLAINYVNSKK
jgi:hypothetical protein